METLRRNNAKTELTAGHNHLSGRREGQLPPTLGAHESTQLTVRRPSVRTFEGVLNESLLWRIFTGFSTPSMLSSRHHGSHKV